MDTYYVQTGIKSPVLGWIEVEEVEVTARSASDAERQVRRKLTGRRRIISITKD